MLYSKLAQAFQFQFSIFRAFRLFLIWNCKARQNLENGKTATGLSWN